MSNYVLDACSLIAYYNDEKGAEKIESLIDEVVDGYSTASIHKINLFEVYYDLLRSSNEEKTKTSMELFAASRITIIDEITDEIMKEAARFKLSYKISVADAFALATAKLENATLVTADHHEFDIIDEADELSILWFR
jgi:predicted nucleic acid-binding protein